MARQIVSVKLPAKMMGGMKLRRALRLYESIRESRSTAYFSLGKKTVPLDDLPKTWSALNSVRSKEILLVIEGEDAEAVQRKIIDFIEQSKENARENPGLRRQDSLNKKDK